MPSAANTNNNVDVNDSTPTLASHSRLLANDILNRKRFSSHSHATAESDNQPLFNSLHTHPYGTFDPTSPVLPDSASAVSALGSIHVNPAVENVSDILHESSGACPLFLKPFVFVLRFIRASFVSILISTMLLLYSVFATLTVPFYYVSRSLVTDISERAAAITWFMIQYVFESGTHQLTFSGDELPEGESAIVISNHISWTDFFLISAVARRKRMLSRQKFFAKEELKYVPFLGWAMIMINMIFVRRNWIKDQKRVDRAFQQLKKAGTPAWIVSYPEGTRLTRDKLKEAQDFARSRDLPILKNVLIPRTKGFVATVQSFRGGTHIKAVYDLTLVYRHKKLGFGAYPHILAMTFAPLDPNYEIHVHIRRFPMSASEDVEGGDGEDAVPVEGGEQAISDWVMGLYEWKDELIGRMKRKWTDGLELLDMPLTWT
ncbi:hypothetical protein BJ742DRAFT_840855 [Cladochytrium replicatum]|nr:hypothetical protein BJ742DRAFT_840855 [Cladochytrium replicatum]